MIAMATTTALFGVYLVRGVLLVRAIAMRDERRRAVVWWDARGRTRR